MLQQPADTADIHIIQPLPYLFAIICDAPVCCFLQCVLLYFCCPSRMDAQDRFTNTGTSCQTLIYTSHMNSLQFHQYDLFCHISFAFLFSLIIFICFMVFLSVVEPYDHNSQPTSSNNSAPSVHRTGSVSNIVTSFFA